MKVGVAKETAPGERRVALVPEALGKLHGRRAGDPRRAAAPAPARPSPTARSPTPARRSSRPTSCTASRTSSSASRSRRRPRSARLRTGPGASSGSSSRSSIRSARRRSPTPGVTAISLDAIPRTLSRAQTMDALSLAGQRRRLQGGPHRRQRLPALLPAADDGRRHGQARQRPHPRASASPGLQAIGTATPARRGRPRLRRPTRDPRAGGEPRRPVREAEDDDRRDRRRRLRPRADRRGAGRPAGRAQRGRSAAWTWSSPRPRSPAASRRSS